MSNKSKNKARRKTYKKALNIKNNNMPKNLSRGILITQKTAKKVAKILS